MVSVAAIGRKIGRVSWRRIALKKSGFQFTDPHVQDLEFHVNEEFDESKFEGFQIRSEVSNAVIEADRRAFVRLKLTIGEFGETTPFVCTIVMEAKFEVEEPVATDFFEDLLSVNAPALLMSYARPIIALITQQGGFPSFHLPFMNFTEE